MRSRLATLLALLLLAPTTVLANPKGGQVRSGSAVIRQGAGRVDVHQQSHSATLSWDSFDIDPGEVTQFHQPGKDSVAINRIFQGDASKILGSLQANGHVYLINPHGILFGKEATVNVNALIATTTVDGRELAAKEGFDPSATAVPGAQIVNQGSITSGTGGFVYLIAPYVRNGKDGVITSPGGEVVIEAGATVYLTDRPDGRGFAVEYTAPSGGEAVNLGKILADGGLARLRGELVTQGGLVQANSIREKNGVIELFADSELTLADASVTRAKGGEDAGSHAGSVDAWSDGVAVMEESARIEVSATAEGADGGFAEVSAKERVEVAGTFAARAGKGGERGEIVIDPEEIVIGGQTRFQGAGSVLLAADRAISVAEGASIDLARQAGDGSRAGRQKLEIRSGGDVVFERDALIQDSGTGKVWDVEVVAGESLGGARAPGGGDLVFEGGAGSGLRLARGNARGVAAGDVILSDGAGMSSIEGDVEVIAGGDVVFEAGRTPGIDTVIESGSGDVRVVAEGSVLLQRTLGSGGNAAIRTRGILGTDGAGNVTKTDGGSVLVWAKGGDVDAGIGNRWLEPGPNFEPRTPGAPSTPFDPIPVVNSNVEGPYNVDNRAELADGILGIGTEAGGDVVVIAGGDVRTRSDGSNRSGGTAAGRGTTYDGSHIGAMGVPVVYQSSDFGYRGPVVVADAPENRVIVVAGGDITGDYIVRNGEASLLAGYDLPAGVDSLEDLATLGLDSPGNLQREDLRRDLDVSALAGDDRRGWVGTLANPITVDLIEGSVDMLGRNGVAVRAVENPSLVYPPVEIQGVAKAPTYAEDSFALLEAETGDVVLIGNQAVTDQQPNALVWLLPPSLIVRTHAEDGERPGDFVQVEDFTLFPSASGGVELDVAGKARTANGAASGQAVLNLSATTSGAAADLAFTIPAGTKLRDPETGLIFELSAPLEFQVRRAAEKGTVSITFVAEPGFENQEVVIPAGTRVEDYGGRIYETTGPQSIPAPEQRFSEGTVRFKPAGGEATAPIRVPAGTLFQTPGGALFETLEDGNLQIGDRGVSVPVRNVVGMPVTDAGSGELSLVTPIAGIASATNRQPTLRPASFDIVFTALDAGQSDTTSSGRIKTLLTPVFGARIAPGEAPSARGGSDIAENGQPTANPTARATVIGPVGELAENALFEIVDARVLPRGVTPDMIQIEATGIQTAAGLVPSVLKEPAADGRPDLAGTRISVVDPQTVWQRTAGSATASLRQSDADPGFDARNQLLSFRYQDYYRACRSGVACDLFNPVTGEAGILAGGGPTHQGDRTAASLHARLGFDRIGFELAESATLLAGPGEGEDFSGTQADILDVTLVTQHTNAGDVTTVSAPYGDVRFAAEERLVRDQQTGLTAALPTNVLAGVTVAGPGRLDVRVGVEGGKATGVGGELALSNVTIAPDASARGIETVGNLVNPTLPVGGAAISVTTAGDVLLNERGAIDSLQGGNIDVVSLGGSLIGGEPEESVTAKRGIFTLFVPAIGAAAAESGGGSINIDVAGSFNIGKSVTAALSGGDIVLRARTGSISAGSASPFEILSITSSPSSNLPEVLYEGGGIFASTGSVEIVAEEDVDIGAGITGGTIAIAAGGNINAGQGAISASGNVSIDAGGTISGTISAAGAISIGSGSVSQSASLSAGGLVVGAGSVGSNTGPGKVGAETAVATSRPAAEQAAAQNAVAGGQSRRSGVQIDVTSRPASCDGVDSGDPDDEC